MVRLFRGRCEHDNCFIVSVLFSCGISPGGIICSYTTAWNGVLLLHLKEGQSAALWLTLVLNVSVFQLIPIVSRYHSGSTSYYPSLRT